MVKGAPHTVQEKFGINNIAQHSGEKSLSRINCNVTEYNSCSAVFRTLPTEALDKRSQVEGTPHTTKPLTGTKLGHLNGL